MNLDAIRVTTERPHEDDPKHAAVILAGAAYHDPPGGHAIPEDVPDVDYFAARARAAGVLARVAVLALPHLEAERRGHHCGAWWQGEPLTRHPGQWELACGISLAEFDPNGDGSCPVALYLEVPAKRAKVWATACKDWLAEVGAQDTYAPPVVPVAWDQATPGTVHQLRAGAR